MTHTPLRFFTSDTHFGHARILELSARPFPTVSAMNVAIVDRAYAAGITDADELWVLGDLAMGDFAESMKWAAALPGIKHLVVGNHEKHFDEPKQHRFDRYEQAYVDAGFTVHHGHVLLEVEGRQVLASHFPYFGDSQDNDRHVAARPEDRGLPLLHGHIHGVRHIDGRMFNVGVDVNDFTPVSPERIAAWLDEVSPR